MASTTGNNSRLWAGISLAKFTKYHSGGIQPSFSVKWWEFGCYTKRNVYWKPRWTEFPPKETMESVYFLSFRICTRQRITIMHIHHYLIQLETDCQHTDPTKACQSVSIGTLPEPVSQSVSIKVLWNTVFWTLCVQIKFLDSLLMSMSPLWEVRSILPNVANWLNCYIFFKVTF